MIDFEAARTLVGMKKSAGIKVVKAVKAVTVITTPMTLRSCKTVKTGTMALRSRSTKVSYAE